MENEKPNDTDPPWNNPDDVIKLAEAEEQPPLPVGGIPKQRVPGWIRWPIRAIFLPFVLLDLAAQKFVRFFIKPPYKQVGGCNQRGNCCFFIIIPEPKGWLTRLYYYWNTEINGFYPRHPEPMDVDGDKVKVMGCRYLQKDGRCSHYRLRPTICREWPQIEYFGPPKILKGCGFHAVPRKKDVDPYPQDKQPSENKLNVLK